MPSFENLNDSEEYIAQAEDRRAEHRPPRRKLGNNGAGIGKKEKKPFLKKFNLSRELNKDVPNEQFSSLLEAEMPSFENFSDSAEYISRAEDRRAEQRPPRLKLGNYGAGFGKQGEKTPS